MNANTKEDLQEFIGAVKQLAYAVSSFAGTDAVQKVLDTADTLIDQLDSDETILQ
jgi:hypothetical protein